MKKELLPCPKCGTSEDITLYKSDYLSVNRQVACCEKCKHTVVISDTDKIDITTKWNEICIFMKSVTDWSREDLENFVKISYLSAPKEFIDMAMKKTKAKQVFRDTCQDCKGTGIGVLKQGFLETRIKCPACKGSGLL
jgi:hypothetical protein